MNPFSELLLDLSVRHPGAPLCLAPEVCSLWLGKNAAGDNASRKGRMPTVAGNVAVLPLEGVLTPKGGWFNPGTEAIGRAFDAAMANPQIGGVVFDVNSPGGVSYGTPELGDRIYAARGSKPVVAVANPMAASAAYWVATAADRFVVTPSGDVGSVGVWQGHVDYSAAMEKEGVKVTFVYAGRYKVEGHPYEPLSDEARAEMQRGVDETYAQFIDAVARNRKTTLKDVRENYGEGRMLEASRAVAAGMADRVATLDQVLGEMLPEPPKRGGRERAAELTAMLCAAWEGTPVEAAAVEPEPEGLRAEDARRRRERRNREAVA